MRREKAKQSLELDVAELVRKLGPVKVALIGRWIREVNGPVDALIARHMSPGARVLDVGCSRGDPDLPAMFAGRYCVGVDMDLPGLRANHLANAVVHAPIARLPFADDVFDLVVCKWVAEHLEDPIADFGECARVLRPGGVLVLLTPNLYSVFTAISHALPYRLKQRLKGRLFQGHEEDTFRTWYRANSKTQLDAVARAAGLAPVHFERLPGMWTFFIFNRPVALAVRAFEQVQQRIPLLNRATTYLLAAYKKPTQSG